MRFPFKHRASTLGLLWLSACTGSISDPDSAGTPPVELPPSGPTTMEGPGGPTSAPGNGAGVTPLRRLTRLQYNNTLRDLLGDTSNAGETFFPADTRGTNRFTTGGVVSNVEARAYYEAAKAIGASVATRLSTLYTCDLAASGESACADEFIRSFGLRAFRRPVGTEENAGLRAIYDWARSQEGYVYEDAIRVVLQAMLQSPAFIYHQEVATRPGATETLVRLTPYEMASRLSYFLWSSMPDSSLFAEAGAGRLLSPAELSAEARRMLADGRAADTLRTFHSDWLLLDQLAIAEKDTNRFPDFTEQARTAMQAETGAFVSHVFQQDGRLESLFTANYTFADASLAKIYDVPAPTGQGLQRIELNPAQGRSGLLTQLGVLANAATPYSTSPVRRGKFVREQMLCQDLPPPDPDVDTSPPAPAENVSGRQLWAQHSADPACSGCHALMDPIGFAFENFDAIGRFRSMDGGAPVDASGQITGSASSDGSFTGVAALARHLLGSEQVHRCLTQQWFRFAMGRMEGPADERSVVQAHQAFASSGLDMRELLVALTQTNGFTFRSVALGEISP